MGNRQIGPTLGKPVLAQSTGHCAAKTAWAQASDQAPT